MLILQLKSCWSLWHATINVSIIKNYKLFGDYFDNLLSSSSCKEKEEKQIFEKSKFQELYKNIQFYKENLYFFQKQRFLKAIQNIVYWIYQNKRLQFFITMLLKGNKSFVL